jgi:hypothetical protein
VRVGDRIAVRVHFGTPQHLVHPLDQTLGYHVLELFGLVVHFVPLEAHHLNKKELDQPVPPNDHSGEPFTGSGQPDTRVRRVVDQA